MNDLEMDFEYELRFALSILTLFKQKRTLTEVIRHVSLSQTHPLGVHFNLSSVFKHTDLIPV
jgi:hypothetical protein